MGCCVMHEMAYLKRVLDVVVDAGQKDGAKEIDAIYLTVGEMRDFVDDFVQGFFSYLARGTIAQNAKIVMNRVPMTVRCNKCGTIYHFDIHDDSSTACPNCGAQDYQLNTGRELAISHIMAK